MIPENAMRDGHRYVMGAINSYCPKCSEQHSRQAGRNITALDCDEDNEK